MGAIRADSSTQPRAGIHEALVADYDEAMRAGDVFPPVVAFDDGADYWLADGYHRTLAAQQVGSAEIEADVRQGTHRDAILFSVGANATHGARRTNADKRRAVMTLLSDAAWRRWSNRVIAEKCGVGHSLVEKLRSESLSAHRGQIQPARIVERNGTQYTMNTAKIGAPRVGKTKQSAATEMLTEIMSAAEVSREYFLSESAVVQGIRRHTIPARKAGSVWLLLRKGAEARWAKRRRRRGKVEAAKE